MQHIANSLNKITNNILEPRGLYFTKLLNNWRAIAGEFADYTYPFRLTKGSKSQTSKGNNLVINITNEAMSATIPFYSGVITEKISTFFGFPLVQNISWRLVPQVIDNKLNEPVELLAEDKENLCFMLATIEDDVLKNKLFNLGEAIITSSKNR